MTTPQPLALSVYAYSSAVAKKWDGAGATLHSVRECSASQRVAIFEGGCLFGCDTYLGESRLAFREGFSVSAFCYFFFFFLKPSSELSLHIKNGGSERARLRGIQVSNRT